VSDELRTGVLKRVLPTYGGAADVSIFAVYPTRHLVPFKVRAFVDYFARLYGSEPYWDRDLAPPLTQVVPLAAAG
jgi:DNA-binding transcriptional LysR family regulator